jgi:hypothetical protein
MNPDGTADRCAPPPLRPNPNSLRLDFVAACVSDGEAPLAHTRGYENRKVYFAGTISAERNITGPIRPDSRSRESFVQ